MRYSLNISEISTGMSMPHFLCPLPPPSLGWCILLLCGKDVMCGTRWGEYISARWRPLWTAEVGQVVGPTVLSLCFLDFFVLLHLLWPSPRRASSSAARVKVIMRQPHLLPPQTVSVGADEQALCVRTLRDSSGSLGELSSQVWEPLPKLAWDLWLLPWSERKPGWRERETSDGTKRMRQSPAKSVSSSWRPLSQTLLRLIRGRYCSGAFHLLAHFTLDTTWGKSHQCPHFIDGQIGRVKLQTQGHTICCGARNWTQHCLNYCVMLKGGAPHHFFPSRVFYCRGNNNFSMLLTVKNRSLQWRKINM